MKKIIIFTLLIICLFFGNTQNVLAEEGDFTPDTQTYAFTDAAGFSRSTTIGDVASTGIQIFLSLLGIIFIILIVYSGYLWMMAQGNEEDIEKAKKIIRNSIIGLIIVIAAYSITYFVFSSLAKIDGGSGGPVMDTGGK